MHASSINVRDVVRRKAHTHATPPCPEGVGPHAYTYSTSDHEAGPYAANIVLYCAEGSVPTQDTAHNQGREGGHQQKHDRERRCERHFDPKPLTNSRRCVCERLQTSTHVSK